MHNPLARFSLARPAAAIALLSAISMSIGCQGSEDNPIKASAVEFLKDWRANSDSSKHYEVTGRACYHLGGYICPMHWVGGMDRGKDGKSMSGSAPRRGMISCYKIDKKIDGKVVVVKGQLSKTAPGDPDLSGCDIVSVK